MSNRIRRYRKGILDDLTIRRKLIVLFLICVLLPLFVTDAVILHLVRRDEETRTQYEMGNIANAMEADFVNIIDDADRMTRSFFINRSINEFLDKDYSSDVEFYEARYALVNQPFAQINLSDSDYAITMYSDNPTIISGGAFIALDGHKDEEWYKAVKASDKDAVLISYFIGDEIRTETSRKRLAIVRKLDYYKNLKYEKYIKIEVDYGSMVRRFNNRNYSLPVYLCEGDRILYSNEGYSDVITPYEELKNGELFAHRSDFEIYGTGLTVLVKSQADAMLKLYEHLPLLVLLLLVNILLPAILMYMINRSFVSRLRILNDSFDNVNAAYDSLETIEDAEGKDEIGNLMRNYNKMVTRLKDLIRTVYEERLRKQELELSRRQAELDALHSQINPHFLFNVLESIRMHSVIKKEDETAGMIERLALLQRQNVNWSDDNIRIKDEIRFVEAYLELQKYRFGDKLSYQISIRNGCENYYIPKLTLETFVENACVHGAEHKAGVTYIYIRVYEQADRLYMEVEDTGDGMDDDEVRSLNERLDSCTIDDLRAGKHVGVINACLRLKMHTSERSSVAVESEKGVGTTILISIPLDTLEVYP